MKNLTKNIKIAGVVLISGLGINSINNTTVTESNTNIIEEKIPEANMNDFRTVNNSSFKAGEKLTYRLHFGIVDAGEATLEVKKTSKKAKGRELLHVVGKGRTLGAFNWFFKVRDRYESYIDAEGIFPWLFIRRVNEGGYITNQDYVFKQDEKKVKTQDNKTFETTANIQDMISSFYYTRTLDFSKAKVNDAFSMDMFIDNQTYPFKVKYLGKETIKTRKGKFECIKMRPLMMSGDVWKSEESVTIWVTNDVNKIPVLIQSKIAVGSVKATLTKWEGLTKPLVKL